MPQFFALSEFRNATVNRIDEDDFGVCPVYVGEGGDNVRLCVVRCPFRMVEGVSGGRTYRLYELSGAVRD